MATPYTFTKSDAETTVSSASALLGLYPDEAQPELVELRAEVVALGETGPPEEIVDDVFAKILSGRECAARAGSLPAPTSGSIAQLSVSNGGVPKTAVDSVEVGFRGVTTDRQRNRKYHGLPYQALCLWSQEVIDDLAGQGHPIAAGCAGENITTSGIEWSTLTMGTRLRIGEVLAQITSFAVPCAHQAQWFSDRDFSRLDHEKGSISRIYATVLEPGNISVGDEILVEPGG